VAGGGGTPETGPHSSDIRRLGPLGAGGSDGCAGCCLAPARPRRSMWPEKRGPVRPGLAYAVSGVAAGGRDTGVRVGYRVLPPLRPTLTPQTVMGRDWDG